MKNKLWKKAAAFVTAAVMTMFVSVIPSFGYDEMSEIVDNSIKEFDTIQESDVLYGDEIYFKSVPDRSYIDEDDIIYEECLYSLVNGDNGERLYNQFDSKWKNYTYNTGNLYDTGCGIFSFCNAIYALYGIRLDVTEVASWAYQIGAYNRDGNEGTYRVPFYDNVISKYGNYCNIELSGYKYGTIYDSELKNHLANGGVAVAHVYGHFIAISGYDASSNSFYIIDSAVTRGRGLPANGWISASSIANNSKSKVDWFALLKSKIINPTYAKISTQDNRTEFLTGEEVNFKMESDGTANYTIGIDKDGQRILTTDVGTYNNEYNYLLTEPGHYSAYVSNYYMDGTNHVESNVVEFNVTPRLLAPNVSVDVQGKNVRLFWDEVPFATHYDVRVYYEDGTSYADYWGGIPAKTYIDLELPVNQKFYAQVCSANVDYGNFTYCEPVYFETGLNSPELKAPDVKVSVSGRKVTLTWNAVKNATHYDVRVYYEDGTSYADYWGGIPAETYKELVLPADTKFNVIVCSANKDYGNFTYCNPIYFTTGHDVPTWAKISIINNKSEFTVGEQINFKMEADIADNFCISIFCDDNGVETAFLNKGTSNYSYIPDKAGEYSAYISASVNGGTEYVDSDIINFTVRSLTATASVTGTYTYTGKPIIPTLTVKVGGTVLTKGTDYTVTATNNINAGTARYTVKAVSGGNYSFADVTGTFTINKAEASVLAVPKAISGLKYNGKSQALITAGTAQNGTMVYAVGSAAYSSNVPTATEPGTYTVYYKAQGSGNYTDSSVGKVTVTIENFKEEIKNISVRKNSLYVRYGYPGSNEISRSVNVVFKDVTVEMVDWLNANDANCGLLADFVNAFSNQISNAMVLTDAQLKAIEYVLQYDYALN